MKKRSEKQTSDAAEGMLLSKQSADRVHQILARMPQRDRELLRAIFLEERDKEEICQGLQVDRDYLRVLVRRAKARFSILYNGASMSQFQPHTHLTLWCRILLQREQPGASAGKDIVRPPGSLLRGLSEFLLSQKTLERIVNPTLSDMQTEYCQALADNRTAKAVWVRIRGYWSFFKTIGLYSVMKTLVEMWRKVSSV